MLRPALLTGILAAGLAATAAAAPKVTPLGDGEFRGVTNYSVECDSGKKSIVQCRRDQQHCGYSYDQTVAVVAEKRCDAAAAQAPVGTEAPQPAPETDLIESRPAKP